MPLTRARASRMERLARIVLTCLAGAAGYGTTPVAAQLAPNAAPTGGQVVAGAASIGQGAAVTSITQSSNRAAIDWQSFDVGAQHQVDFHQPGAGALTLNRVVGPNPSEIAGRIQANGQLVIVNQSGVRFDRGSEVEAASLVATTADITNQNLMQGHMVFNRPGNPNAAVRNAGAITVRDRGLAALVAPQVANSGSITARLGHVVLAGAATDTIDLYGDGLVSINVTGQVKQLPIGPDGKPVSVLVTNSGLLRADGGRVTLTAKAVDGLVQTLVDAGGSVTADSAGGQAGRVVVAGAGGALLVSGTLSAQGAGPARKGGSIQVAGTGDVVLAAGARLDVSGGAGGGTVALGTTLARAKGGPSARARVVAANVTAASGAVIDADATATGKGGRVTVLSSGVTTMPATITARGGPGGGDGGAVEVSGGRIAAFGAVDTSAPHGALGSILIDPGTLTIQTGGDTSVTNGTTFTADTTIDPSALNALTGDITLTAQDTITISNVAGSGIALTNGQSLTLIAENQGAATTAFTVGNTVQTGGAITFTAKSGDILVESDITAGGAVRLTAGGLGAGFGSGSISVGAAVSGATVAMSAQGGITQTAGTISATAASNPTVMLTATGGDIVQDAGATIGGAVTPSIGQTTTLTATGGISFAGTIQGDTVNLSATGGVTETPAPPATPAGAVVANTLGVTGATVTLDGPNAVGTLGASSATGGAFALRDTATGALTIGADVSGATVAITAADGIIQTAGTISATAAKNPTVTLTATGGDIVQDAGAIIGGTVTPSIGQTTMLTAQAGGISFAGTVQGDTVNLAATGGDVTETPAPGTPTGAVLANTLGASATAVVGVGGAVTLDGPNAVGTLGASSATGGAFALRDTATGALTIGADVSGATVAITAADGIIQTAGTISATAAKNPTVTLTATGGDIVQDAGAIIGGTVTPSIGQTTMLTAQAGGISFAGTVRGDTVNLAATGDVTETPATPTGAVVANTLGVTGATVTLDGPNAVGTLAAASAVGAFGLSDGRTLTIEGPVTGTIVSITATGSIAVDGDVTGNTVALLAADGITQSGATVSALGAGGSILLKATAGDIDVDGASTLQALGTGTSLTTTARAGSVAVDGFVDLPDGALSGSAATAASFDNQTNLLAAVATFTVGDATPSATLPFSLTDAESLAIPAGETLSAGAVTLTVGGDLTIGGTLMASGQTQLVTSGQVTEPSGGSMQTAVLSGVAGQTTAGVAPTGTAGVTLDTSANAVDYLGPFAATGSFVLVDNHDLVVSGLVQAGASVTIGGTTLANGQQIALTAPSLTVDDSGTTLPTGLPAQGQLVAAAAVASGLITPGLIALQTDVFVVKPPIPSATIIQAPDGTIALAPYSTGEAMVLQATSPAVPVAGTLTVGLDALSYASTLVGAVGAGTVGTQTLELGATPVGGLASAVTVDTGTGTLDLTGIATTLQLVSAGAITEQGSGTLSVAALTGSSGGAARFDTGATNDISTLGAVQSAGGFTTAPGSFQALLGFQAQDGDFRLTDARPLTVVGLVWAGAGDTLSLQAPSLTVDASGAASGGDNGSLLATYLVPATVVTPGQILLRTDALQLLGGSDPIVNAPAGIVALAPLTKGLPIALDTAAGATPNTLSVAAAQLGLVNTTREVDTGAIDPATLAVDGSSLVSPTAIALEGAGPAAAGGPAGTQVLALGSLDGGATLLAGGISFDTNLDLHGTGAAGIFGGVANTLALFASGDVVEAPGVAVIADGLVGAIGVQGGTPISIASLGFGTRTGATTLSNPNSFATLGVAPMAAGLTAVGSGAYTNLVVTGNIQLASTQAVWNADLTNPAGTEVLAGVDSQVAPLAPGRSASLELDVLSASGDGLTVDGTVSAGTPFSVAGSTTLRAGSEDLDGGITVNGVVSAEHGGSVLLAAGFGLGTDALNPDPSAGANGITLAGLVGDAVPAGDVGTAEVTLDAGGDVVQTAGAVTAGALAGLVGGSTALRSLNGVGELAGFSVNQQFDRPPGFVLRDDSFPGGQGLTVVGPVFDSGALNSDGVLIAALKPAGSGPDELTIAAGGVIATVATNPHAAVLLAATGDVIESATASISTRLFSGEAGLLPLTESGGVTPGTEPATGQLISLANLDIRGVNGIDQLGGVTATSSAYVADDFDLFVLGPVLAGVSPALGQAGAPPAAPLSGITASTVPNLDIAAFAGTPGIAADLTIAGPVQAGSAIPGEDGGDVALRAGGLDRPGMVTVEAGGAVAALTNAAGTANGQLVISAGVDPNAVAPIASTDPGCTDAGCAIVVSGSLSGGGVALLAAGSIDETGAIAAGTLAGQAGGRAVLLGGTTGTPSANRVATLNGFASNLVFDDAAGFLLRDGEALAVTGPVSDSGASASQGLALIVAPPGGVAADLTIYGALSTLATNASARVDLEATGGITASGPITAAVFTGRAGLVPSTEANPGVGVGPGSVVLSNTGNAIGTIADVAAGGSVSVVDGANPVTGPGGTLTLAGTILAGMDYGQNAAAIAISGPPAGGSVTLTGSIDAAGAGGGSVTLRSSGALILAGTVAAASGSADIGLVSLGSAGATTETGSIAAGELAGSAGAGGAALSGANSIAMLGNYASAGDFVLADRAGLSISGTVSAAAGGVAISDTAAGGLSLSGAITATDAATAAPLVTLSAATGGLMFAPGSTIQASGAGGTATFAAAAAIAAAGTVTAEAGITVRAGGDVIDHLPGSDSRTGVLRTGLLTGTAGGQFSFAAGNSVGQVSGFAAGSNFTLNDTVALAVDQLRAAVGFVTLTDTAPVTVGAAQAGTSFTLGDTAPVTLTGALAAPAIAIDDPASIVTLAGDTIDTGLTLTPRGALMFRQWPTAPDAGAFITAAQVQQTGVTTVQGFAPTPAGQAGATLRIDLSQGGMAVFDDLAAPSAVLFLGLAANGSGAASARGIVDLQGFYVAYGLAPSGSLSLMGRVGGLTGPEAAGVSFITPLRNKAYQVNACAVESVNCVLLSPLQVPVTNPVDELDVRTLPANPGDYDLVLPNVGETDY